MNAQCPVLCYAALRCLLLSVLQHHADLSAAERAAAETLEAERTRSTQLQQQLAELTASSAEQQRALQAQLTEANQLLAAKSDQVTRLGVQLQQAQEGLASRDADIAQLKSELSQVCKGGGSGG